MRLAPRRLGQDLAYLDGPESAWVRMEADREHAKLAGLACHLMEHGVPAAARPSCAFKGIITSGADSDFALLSHQALFHH